MRWTIIGTTTFSGTYHSKQEVLTKLLAPLISQLEGHISVTADRFIAEGDRVVIAKKGTDLFSSCTTAIVPLDRLFSQLLR
jgi:hypothetical protein